MSFLLSIELNRVKERKICAISLYRDGRSGDGGRRDLPCNVLTVLCVSLGCGLSDVQSNMSSNNAANLASSLDNNRLLYHLL